MCGIKTSFSSTNMFDKCCVLRLTEEDGNVIGGCGGTEVYRLAKEMTYKKTELIKC